MIKHCLGLPKGVSLLKRGTIRSCPFKSLKPLREGWPWDDLGCFGLSVLDQIWELGPRRPPDQHGANLALRPCGLTLGVGPWLAPVRLRVSLEDSV
jgi:hypothetical protein